MAPLYLISIRQLTGRVRLLVTAAFASLPILIASLNRDASYSELDDVLLNGFLVSIVIPLIALATATASFGNEIDDRTLSNLTLTPMPRWKIVLPKLLATMSINGSFLLASVIISVAIAYDGDSDALLGATVGALLGIAAYSALFMWLGLQTSRALLTGLLYVFLWELLFSGFVSGIRFLSVRAYTMGIIHGIDDARFPDTNNLISFPGFADRSDRSHSRVHGVGSPPAKTDGCSLVHNDRIELRKERPAHLCGPF